MKPRAWGQHEKRRKATATKVVMTTMAIKRLEDASPVSSSMLDRLFIIVCLISVELEIASLPPEASLVPTNTPEPARSPPVTNRAMPVTIILGE